MATKKKPTQDEINKSNVATAKDILTYGSPATLYGAGALVGGAAGALLGVAGGAAIIGINEIRKAKRKVDEAVRDTEIQAQNAGRAATKLQIELAKRKAATGMSLSERRAARMK